MYNLTEITATVREYLDDAVAVVSQPIIDSVHFLSNIFSIDSIDETQSTAVDGTTLELPTSCLEVDTVYIDGDEIRKLKSLDDLQIVKDQDQQRWYEFGGKIQFSAEFTSVETTQIFYKKGFVEPEAAVDTDVPHKYLELVYLGAQYRYFNKLISQVVIGRDSVPDVEPDELRKIRDDLKKTLLEQIKIIQMNG